MYETRDSTGPAAEPTEGISEHPSASASDAQSPPVSGDEAPDATLSATVERPRSGASISTGEANSLAYLCALADEWRERGVSRRHILSALLWKNQNEVKPPLAEELVRQIAFPDFEAAGESGSRSPLRTPAPEWNIRGFPDAMKSTETKTPWIVESLLAEESGTLVAALPHAMKSLAWLAACVESVTTHKVWGHFDASGVEDSLFIETEDPWWLVEARIRGIAKGLNLAASAQVPGFHYVCPGPFDLVGQEKNICAQIERHKVNFIVISTLQSLLGGRAWGKQEDMQPLMAMVVRLARACPVVVLTHSPWDRKQRRAAGTVTQAANFLTNIHFEKFVNHQSGETYAHVVVDSKAAARETDFSLKLLTEGDPSDPTSVRGIEYVGEGWPKGIAKDAVLAALEADPEADLGEIADRAGVSRRYVQRIAKGCRSGRRGPKRNPKGRAQQVDINDPSLDNA
jgi:hypothetical protein